MRKPPARRLTKVRRRYTDAMATLAAERLYTAEEFLALPDNEGYELDDGKLVERHVGRISSKTAVRIGRYLSTFVDSQRLGDVYDSSVSLRLHPSRPARLPRADVSFLSTTRLGNQVDDGVVEGPPDLVVEVVSRSDQAARIEAKVGEYLEAGVRLVWVVYPEARRVHVFTPDHRAVVLSAQDTLDGGDVLPGFAVTVGDLIPA